MVARTSRSPARVCRPWPPNWLHWKPITVKPCVCTSSAAPRGGVLRRQRTWLARDEIRACNLVGELGSLPSGFDKTFHRVRSPSSWQSRPAQHPARRFFGSRPRRRAWMTWDRVLDGSLKQIFEQHHAIASSCGRPNTHCESGTSRVGRRATGHRRGDPRCGRRETGSRAGRARKHG